MEEYLNTKKRYLAMLIFISINFLSAKVINSSEIKLPTWTSESPKGDKFLYYTGIGSSKKTLEEAKQIAISDAISEIIQEGKITIDGTIYSKSGEYENNDSVNTINEIVKEINIKGETQKIAGLKTEDVYWQEDEKGNELIYRYWILMRLPQNIEDTNFQINQTYGFAPVWRSALIPGWGQFYKKQTKKSYIFLGSETVLVGVALFSNYLSIHYNDKANKEMNITTRKEYMDWSDSAEAIAITTGIAAGVVYIYNVFDSIISKGAKKYAANSNQIELYVNINKENFSISLSKKW